MRLETNSLVIHGIPFHPNICAIHKKNGGSYRDRTCGPLIKSQLLYQLS